METVPLAETGMVIDLPPGQTRDSQTTILRETRTRNLTILVQPETVAKTTARDGETALLKLRDLLEKELEKPLTDPSQTTGIVPETGLLTEETFLETDPMKAKECFFKKTPCQKPTLK
jgi:hypothetical protein